MAVDRWSQGPGQQIKYVSLFLSKSFALDNVLTGDGWPIFITTVDHVVGQQDSLEGAGGVATLLARKASEGCDNLQQLLLKFDDYTFNLGLYKEKEKNTAVVAWR